MDKNILPAVIFGFNRPNKLQRVLDALKPQAIDYLIIFIDGPRVIQDENRVTACQNIARQVDWAEKELHFWKDNHGLGRISENIALVFEKYTSAIFLEDDCYPVPGFYTFMKNALIRYQELPQVFSIGGYQPVLKKYFRNYSYSLVSCERFICWGWATWHDRWKEIETHFDKYIYYFDDLKCVPNSAGSDLPVMARMIANGTDVESWAIPVTLISLWLAKVHLISTNGLIRNKGNHIGIHGSYSNILRNLFLHNKNVSKHAPIKPKWLEDTQKNIEYALALQKRIKQIEKLSLRKWFHL